MTTSNSLAISPAESHHLISLLYEGALSAIGLAKESMLRQEIEFKGEAICKAISIIGEGLQASLNKESGGEIANGLSDLYTHMILRLNEAHVKNDPQTLDEVSTLLHGIKEAWDAIKPNA